MLAAVGLAASSRLGGIAGSGRAWSFAASLRAFGTAPKPYPNLSVGVPRETFKDERRVSVTPDRVAWLKKAGVGEVCVEKGAGIAAGFTDAAYEAAGAKIVDASKAFAADVVLKASVAFKIGFVLK